MKKVLKKILKVIIDFVFFAYCKIVHRVKIIGTENIPKEGALIFCGNHRTYLDPILIQTTGKRKMNFLAKEELYHNIFLAALGHIYDAIPVKRDSKDINALKTSLKILKDGDCIALFPEGTRNGLEKGQKVKDGAAFFALRSKAKVVPIGISGGTGAFDKVTIKYGKPLDFSEYDKNDDENLEKITNIIMDNIIKLTK